MEIEQIKASLESSNSQERLRAVTALRHYNTGLAVPLLVGAMGDREFIVRSFIAMGLGKKRNADAFNALLELVNFDTDANVRAEAANSLSLFGQVSLPHLVKVFKQDNHWLVRRSILAAMVEMHCDEELFEVCVCGLRGDDSTVREASLEGLGLFVDTAKEQEALNHILSLANNPKWRIRARVAKTLAKFSTPQAQEALLQLRQDENYRVVGATLESLVS